MRNHGDVQKGIQRALKQGNTPVGSERLEAAAGDLVLLPGPAESAFHLGFRNSQEFL